jgi:hypothetical protein
VLAIGTCSATAQAHQVCAADQHIQAPHEVT